MIVSQGYPLWAVLNDDKEGLFLDPVIAWEYEEGSEATPHPIGAWYGDLGQNNVREYVTDVPRWREEQLRLAREAASKAPAPGVEAPYVRESAPVSYLKPKRDESPRPNPTAEF